MGPMAGFSLRRNLATVTLAAALLVGGCGRDEGGATRIAAIGPKPKLVETVLAPLSPGDALLRSNMAQGLVRFDERGRSTGWWNAAFFFGQFLTPILIGALVAALGGLPTAVGVVGVACALVAVALGVRLRRAAPVAAPTEEPVVAS